MREALARNSSDFVVAEPRRRKPAPRKSRLLGFTGIARIVRNAAHYPNQIAGALLIGFAAAITINALELQTMRHPAPLFGHATRPVQRRPSTAAEPAPAVTPRVTAAAPPAPAATQTKAAAAPAPVAHAAPADPLGQFIRRDETVPPLHKASAKPSPHASFTREADPIGRLLRARPHPITPQSNQTVLAAQRALVKLGFVLQADGLAGEATRKAIRDFERDHHLPQDGALTPRLIRRLSADSKIAIP